MRRLALIALVAVAVVVAVIVLADDGDDAYTVTAIFDNASTLVSGEDVKVAGAAVGVVESMDVTEDNRAAVTLRIDNADFTPFKTDANCIIRLQGLIGERFVECDPGSTGAPALREHDDERVLPVARTHSPVDLDLINNIMRLPYRERFALVLNELGTGLAGRGEDLNEVIHRANPALRETERVVQTLADQNRALVRLARDSDTALAPLARERRRVSDFIVQANDTATASAERREDIRRGIALLPGFLRELRPLMADLEGFADDATPVVRDLGQAAPALSRLIVGQGELATAARESFPSLGDALERGRPALIGARPLIRNLGRFAKDAKPVSQDLDDLTASLDETQGPERLMDFLYYSTLAINGFDGIGHYLRAGLVTNTCSNYSLEFSPGCNATFYDSTAAAADAGPRLAPEPTPQQQGGSVAPTGPLLQELLGTGESAAQTREREQNMQRLRQQAERPPGLGPQEPALEYLLGEDG